MTIVLVIYNEVFLGLIRERAPVSLALRLSGVLSLTFFARRSCALARL